MAAYALGALPLAFVIYSAPLYLNKVRGVSQAGLGALLWIPPLGWEVGYFFWGWISDRFRRGGQVSFNSLFLLLMVLSLPLAMTARAGALPLLMFGLFFAMFIAAGFVILSIAYATEVFSAAHSGLIAGLGAGSWSAVIALVMPVFGRLFDLQRYDTAFGIAAIFPVSGYVLWRAFGR
jgi:ACS family hexuronate transporter-like MFS transporter